MIEGRDRESYFSSKLTSLSNKMIKNKYLTDYYSQEVVYMGNCRLQSVAVHALQLTHPRGLNYIVACCCFKFEDLAIFLELEHTRRYLVELLTFCHFVASFVRS